MRTRVKRTPKPAPVTAQANGDNVDAADEVDERIYATLAAAINQGALKPGAKILEDTIAEHFKVSRTVVRGALGILQRDHLLERKRNRGTFVAEPSVDEARQLFEARRALECTILEMVVGRATPEGLNHLGDIVDDEKRIHAGSDQPSKTGLLGQFHIELAKLSGNSVMTELLSKVVARLSLVMARFGVDHSDECGADHHLAIVEAVRGGKSEQALQLMTDHLADIERRVRLVEDHGDRNSFESVLAAFSGQ